MKLLLSYLHLLIFLSLTATPPTTSKYAKTGCSDKCGNVRIPYPFGIGAECSISQWYIVDCKNSRPYLPALNDLEVLGVDLGNQTVTVSTPRITNCLNPFLNSSEIKGVDLGGSPFLFSKSHNTFVFKGCGAASLMADNRSVVTGCSTGCLNVTLGDRSNCFGIGGCCQTAIPHYLKSYSVMLTSLERQGNDGGCESAFMVDETSYDQGKFSDQFIVGRNNSFIPVSLLCTLTDSHQITCCYAYIQQRLKVPMFDGTIVDTFKCNLNYYSRSVEGNPYLIDGCTRKVKIAKYAKTGCNDMCGNVKIPFPFGIGVGCSINQWYVVDCNSSTPYLPALNHLELLGVNLEQQIVDVSKPSISYCQNPIRNNTESMRVDLGSSPFWFSNENNIFFFEGCGTAALMSSGSVLTACSTSCLDVTFSDKYNCFGIGGCCQSAIPNLFKSYNIQFTGLKDGGCGSAFMVDKTSYDQRRLFDPFIYKNISSTRISLLWTITDSNQVNCCFGAPERITVGIVNGTTVDTSRCYTHSDAIGNPYLEDGCDFDNGEDSTSEECRRCRHRGGYCGIERAYDVDGSIFSENFACYDEGRISLGVILSVGISAGALFLVAISYASYKWIKKTRRRSWRRRMFIKRNGGLLLKQQEEADSSLVGKTILFTSRELEKATDNFNENRILGRGGHGTVYKGMLVDGRIVAIKKSKVVDESQLEQFINEVVILSQVNHRNVVKLLGCCLETDVPLLVSEFIPNGTLYDRLHDETNEFLISLNMRLQMATEVAGALAYLHSATSIPIYHRNIKTTNILLDDNYRAKVSDFGTSRFVCIDQTHLTTLVKGTFGYLDPEYFQSSQFTEKSDVYSFGVVLVELLTGEKPISLTRFGENRSLATHFMLAMEEGRVMSIFDATVIKEGTRDELLVVAKLAMRCLSMNGKYRPTMKEVATELETIRRSRMPHVIQTNTSPMVFGEELPMLTYGESSSTFSSFNVGISQ